MAQPETRNDRALGNPNATVTGWHTPPPPDPILARRLKNLRWEKVALLATTLLGLLLLVPLGRRLLHFSFFWVYSVPFCIAFYKAIWTRRSPTSVAHLMDLPPTPGQFPVHVKYTVDGVTYGVDAGVATFVGSWITFQGLESEFAFRTKQVQSKVIRSSSQPSRAASQVELSLGFHEDRYLRGIVIRAFDQVDGVGTGYKRNFYGAISAWRNSEEVTCGHETLPPLTPHPASVNRARANRLMWITLTLIPILIIIVALTTFGVSGTWTFLLATCALGCVAFANEARKAVQRFALLQSLAQAPPTGQPTEQALPVSPLPTELSRTSQPS